MKGKSENGITLIALIVTIIILIILAGISISLVFRNSGIIEKAKFGKEEYTNATEDEKNKLQRISNYINDNIDKNGNSGEQHKILAEEVTHIPNDSNWNVRTVKEALDYLYEH